MAEDFFKVMKEFNIKSLGEKMNHITTVLDKTIQYFTYKIDEIERNIRSIDIKLLLNKKMREKLNIEEKVPEPDVVHVSVNGTAAARENLMKELNDMFKKRRDIPS